jgi:hypothetical protein
MVHPLDHELSGMNQRKCQVTETVRVLVLVPVHHKSLRQVPLLLALLGAKSSNSGLRNYSINEAILYTLLQTMESKYLSLHHAHKSRSNNYELLYLSSGRGESLLYTHLHQPLSRSNAGEYNRK